MAIRIGIGFGGWPFPENDPALLWSYVDTAEAMDVDSIWLSDRVVSDVMNVEPVVALAFMAARTTKMKFGTSVLALPLRNPTVLAKEVATLDFLSNGRALPAVGLGTEDLREYEACGTTRAHRVGRTEEAIRIMRLLWAQDGVTYHGKHFTLNDVTVQPKPVQRGLPPIWIGGRTEAAMRRVARLGDGWLVSQATPGEAGEGIRNIKALLKEYGREGEIEEDHYGALVSFCLADKPAEARRLAEPYILRRRSDVDYAQFSAFGPPGVLSDLLDRFIDAGVTKFVLRPACPPDLMQEQLESLEGTIRAYQGAPDPADPKEAARA